MIARSSLQLLFILPTLAMAEPETNAVRKPDDAASTEKGAGAMSKFSVAPGLRVDLWAEEPLFANPVSFVFDEKGRAYVVETYRRRTSVPDIRKNTNWLADDLAFRTVEDRAAFLKRTYPDAKPITPTKDLVDFNKDGGFDWRDFEVESERIKLVEDSDGDGRADRASVYAEGFNSLVTGVAAGIATRGGDVWFTDIPDLWRIRAGVKEKLLSGFGVHVVFSGHEMHGLRFGPDGRIYWSIADCGAHVVSKEGRTIDFPDGGAVFRANPDGTDLELFATGLRNPQELCFNDVGDLFTGDNNADGGDKARWTHLVEGGEYGWRIGWQFLKTPMVLGAWNAEKTWGLDVDTTNYAVLPPVGHIGHGPSGITHYPGTGLPDAYRDHFFYADFPGGVRSFALVPRGASYSVENPKDFLQDNSAKNMTGKLLWGLFPSDVEFGVDGGVYVLDWVEGWEKTGKGRIFRVHDPAVDSSAIVAETKALLGADLTTRPVAELGQMMGHADQRVRQAAQFELVRRGDPVPLAQATLASHPRLMRLHGIWGVGQLARAKPEMANRLMPMFADADPEVRGQWAKFVGDARVASEEDLILGMLTDAEPRVRFFAAMALAKIGGKEAVQPLFAMLRANADKDAYLRHAAAFGLAACAEPSTLAAMSADGDVAVRAGALLALRRQSSQEVARFLSDKNPQLILEAARAIHDGGIPSAWSQLAAIADRPGGEPLTQRALNANFLIGTAEGAERLKRIAGDRKLATAVRLDAIHTLAIWNDPFTRDRITGLWRSLPKDRAKPSVGALVTTLLGDGEETIRIAGAELAGALKATDTDSALRTALADRNLGGKTRAAALAALNAIASPGLAEMVKMALADTDKTVLDAARALAAKASPALAVEVNAKVLGKGSIREQQEALGTIAAQDSAEADRVLSAQLDALLAGKLPTALHLDLLAASGPRKDPAIQKQLAAFEASRKADDPLAKWRECLDGGNAVNGRAIFEEKAEAACLRCHKLNGTGGDVGPDLTGIGKRQDRAQILRSIVDPNADIAPGFASVLLTMRDGSMVAGILKNEDAASISINSLTDGKLVAVPKANVKERTGVPSPMPPGLDQVLGKRDLRDLVEFLANLK